MAVESRNRTVYYSPRRRRHFMTAKAAARAEATCRVTGWFPSEKYDNEGNGWHFTEEPRLVAVRDRLYARYLSAIRKGATP